MGKIQISGEVIETKAIAFDKDGTLFHAIPFWQEIDRMRKYKFSQIVGKKYEPLWEKAVGFVPPNKVDFKGLLAVASEEEEIIVVASLLYQIKNIHGTVAKSSLLPYLKKVMSNYPLNKLFILFKG